MTTLLTIAFLGNLIDTAATLYLSSMGYTEINPIMAPLLRFPAVFAVVKLFAMGCALHPVAQQGAPNGEGAGMGCCRGVWGNFDLLWRVFYDFDLRQKG